MVDPCTSCRVRVSFRRLPLSERQQGEILLRFLRPNLEDLLLLLSNLQVINNKSAENSRMRRFLLNTALT